ncbi:flavodoxin [Lacrimispora indolis]|uniref:flavodoxin n=1 Tax=Lacrimispora indolis TaxID=69825 RepID=UPI001FA6DB7B|nr:flavodoxin [[Clostridium] methoxybenzovorans]
MRRIRIKQLRLLALLLTAVLMCFLAACGNSQKDISPSSDSQEPATTQSAQATQLPETDTSGNKILIAYFTAAENSGVDAISSASYTNVNGTPVGRVRAVADWIAEETGGELFSIQTSVVYPTDGGKLIDYAAEEQDEKARPELTSQIENLDQYDTIFIGYPTWWYDMPMVMYSFFEEYDFTGKTIIPFNVHNGSRFSGTIETIQELEPEATVVEDGFTVSERTVADAAGDIASWLDELGY